MPTAFTHAFAAAALTSLAPRGAATLKLLLVAGALAVLPDVDVAAFRLKIDYDHPLGHRGFTHSLLFALLAGFLALAIFFRERTPGTRAWWLTGSLLSFCAASHGLLDAFTDAGLGVGFFIPFDDGRYFFPWRPLATSPLGVSAFLGGPAVSILWNEVRWVWLPVAAVAALVHGVRRATRGSSRPGPDKKGAKRRKSSSRVPGGQMTPPKPRLPSTMPLRLRRRATPCRSSYWARRSRSCVLRLPRRSSRSAGPRWPRA